jgi:uncharacterized protein (DUF1330 family)
MKGDEMAKGYWLPQLDVTNPEAFMAYRTPADAWHKTNGSKLLARGGRCEVVEGKVRARMVVRQFDSFEIAMARFKSPEYQACLPLRTGHAVCDFPIVEGYDGPQPEPIGTPPASGPRKGYWVAHADITDPEGYKAYQAANAVAFSKFGARFLVRGGQQVITEGHVRSRSVVLEFPSYEAALACYRSPEYQAAKALRQGKAEFDLIVNDGYAGD